ncbi:MAG TPA: hypothetical protein VF656_11525 [Pyrinomonadaceae bacterium]|jgi:hypothetical protein
MFKFLRKDLILVLTVAAVFLSLSYAIGFVSDHTPNTTELEPAFLSGERAPKSQTVAGRVWKDLSFEKSFALDSGALADPRIVRADGAGNLYVLDWSDFKIKMFSPDGKLLKAFGEGRATPAGGVAGAFINPTAVSVRPDGELWVCDPLQKKITHFNANGAAEEIKPDGEAYRVAALGDVLATMSTPGGDMLFKVYKPSGEPISSFGQIIQDQAGQGIALDGNIVGDTESGGFIYGGRYMGVMAGYGADGAQRFVVKTIDALPPPKVLDIDGRRKVKRNGTRAILSMSIVGDKLYVLTGTSTGGTLGAGEQVMDVYDKRDGSYQYSLKLPVTCIEAIVRPGYLYTVGDGGVTAWRFKQEA